MDLTGDQIAEASRSFQRLQPYGVSLTSAVDFYIERNSLSASATVTDVFRAHIAAQETKGLRPKSISSTRNILTPFVMHCGLDQISDVSTVQIEHWLQSLPNENRATRRNLLRYLSGLFNYAKAQGMIPENPIDRIAKPKVTMKMPEFLPAELVRRVFMSDLPPAALRRCALGFFAGLRSAELDKVVWSDINWQEMVITVRPDVAKTGVTRHVSLSRNCLQWLNLHTAHTKLLCMSQKQLSRLVDTSTWPHNAMRHTFASFHLAMHQDPGKTAFELGHRGDPSLLYRHYRGLATKTDAEQFWAICPEQESNVIRMVG